MASHCKEIGVQWVQILGTEIDMENNAMMVQVTWRVRETIIHFSMIISYRGRDNYKLVNIVP